MFEALAWSTLKQLVPVKWLVIAGCVLATIVSAYVWHVMSVHSAVKEAETRLRTTYAKQFQLARAVANDAINAKNDALKDADSKHLHDTQQLAERTERETEERVRDAEERGRKMASDGKLPLSCFVDRGNLIRRVQP